MKKKLSAWPGLAFSILFLALAIKLALVMFKDAGWIRQQASAQLMREQVLPAKRGDITDRQGNLLAASAAAFQVDADLKTMRKYAGVGEGKLDPAEETKLRAYVDQWAPQIAQRLGLDVNEVKGDLLAKNDQGEFAATAVLGRQLDISLLEDFRAFREKNEIFWLVTGDDTKRYYPNNTMLAQVLGITAGNGRGRFGLEAAYDDDLSGVDGLKISEVDKGYNDTPLMEPIITQPVDGNRLVTTIDEKIQQLAEEVALEGMEKDQPKNIHIVVANPKNGEILAMVNSPSFDLNEPFFTKDADALQQGWRNRVIGDAYEPGSTYKIITMAAALSEGVIKEGEHFSCPGYALVDGVKIHCSNREGHGDQTLEQIMGNSCNTAFIELGQRLGPAKLEAWSRKFGLGSRLGIDLPGEAAGSLDFKSQPTKFDLAVKSMGQATMTTSLQLLNDLNTVLNKGRRTTPHLMRSIEILGEGGKVQRKDYQEKEQTDVLDDEVAQRLMDLLEYTVQEGGSKRAQIEGVRVLGKTGTAQKINPATGQYEAHIASFVGAAPAGDPKVSVYVAVDEPAERIYGSSVAAPLAKKILEKAVEYLP